MAALYLVVVAGGLAGTGHWKQPRETSAFCVTVTKYQSIPAPLIFGAGFCLNRLLSSRQGQAGNEHSPDCQFPDSTGKLAQLTCSLD